MCPFPTLDHYVIVHTLGHIVRFAYMGPIGTLLPTLGRCVPFAYIVPLCTHLPTLDIGPKLSEGQKKA